MEPNFKAFADAIIYSASEGHTLDGADIQDMAIQAGLLKLVEVTEPCGPACVCAEFDFPSECYRKTWS